MIFFRVLPDEYLTGGCIHLSADTSVFYLEVAVRRSPILMSWPPNPFTSAMGFVFCAFVLLCSGSTDVVDRSPSRLNLSIQSPRQWLYPAACVFLCSRISDSTLFGSGSSQSMIFALWHQTELLNMVLYLSLLAPAFSCVFYCFCLNRLRSCAPSSNHGRIGLQLLILSHTLYAYPSIPASQFFQPIDL